MPEGDTIHRSAARLRPALAGHRLVRFEAPRLVGERPRPGERILDVESRGKNLLVHFEAGLTLRTHMRMTGSWHVYRAGERWRKGAHLMRALVEADSGWLGVCFSAPVVETHHRSLGDPAPLAGLGPDLCEPDPDLDVAVERMAELSEPRTEVADALLDQRVAAGIGNVYKSETLFACRMDPFTRVSELDGATRRRLLATAHRLLRANLANLDRQTYDGALAVYGRRGQPCPRCGTPVRMTRQGEAARSTYWCPRCQPSNDPPG